MIFELCTDSVAGALAAGKFGFKRIELCTALSVGGLTPNYGLIKQCVASSSSSGVEVHVMIRHREGDFYYTKEDAELMKTDIEMAYKAGAAGVVFGILNKKNEVSYLNYKLLAFAKMLKLQVTFHRAFDLVSNYKNEIIKIVDFGFDRLLTSGLQRTALEGIQVISSLEESYGDKIEIMAGSGINPSNILKIAKGGIKNFHFTARKKIGHSLKLDMGRRMVTDQEKIKKIVDQF